MTFEERLEAAIAEDAKKLMERYHGYHNALQLEHDRKNKRTQVMTKKTVKVPNYWKIDKKYNPFYVFANRKKLSKIIAKKIEDGTYEPNKPYVKEIPKSSGGTRTIDIYQIPDAAVSKLFFKQLLRKNKHRFSSFSYAYRNDRNVHFAIQDIAVEVSKNSRVFIAEFDFSKFFDSIDHTYLFNQFKENCFSISKSEQSVIKAFLKNREKGIPQGTSISLFLANLVCWKFDRDLERGGLQFARYADDTVIWSQNYTKISKAFDIISEFSKDAGIRINTKKSDGISLLCNSEMRSEIASRKESIEFLGYAVSVDNISIKLKSVEKIKRQISYVLYKHLIQPLNGPKLNAKKFPSTGTDDALLSAISEIRRYLYGNLTDDMIVKYLNGSSNRIFFKGIMSFYPLISNEKQLRQLDGWLITAIHKAMKERKKRLLFWQKPTLGFPFNVKKSDLVSQYKQQKTKGKRLLQVPSFFYMYLALKKGVEDYGVEGVMNTASNEYDY